MKKSDVPSHIATLHLLPRAAADTAVNAMFTAISDAISKG